MTVYEHDESGVALIPSNQRRLLKKVQAGVSISGARIPLAGWVQVPLPPIASALGGSHSRQFPHS